MAGAYSVQLPLSGLQIYPEHVAALETILHETKEAAKADLVLLTDRSGQCISYIGSNLSVDLAVLGSLLAGHIASSQEIARVLKDEEDQEVLVREGKKYNLLSARAGSQLLLLALTSKHVPMGWARVCVLKAIEQLGLIPFTSLSKRPEQMEEPDLESLDQQIGQALGELWLEGNVHQLGEE